MAQAVARLKGNLADTLPESLLLGICADLGLRFRNRTLTPVVTSYLFLHQVLHGNLAVAAVQRLSKLDFTESAYCQARARLPTAFFRRLQRAVTGRLTAGDELNPEELWHGHRLFLLDGSSFSMPDTPELQEAFGQPGAQTPGCGFPTAHLLCLFDARRGYLLRGVPAPLRTHDLSRAALTHQELRPGDVLVGDRAFCSYAHLALCRRRRLHGLFRAHQKLIIDFRPHRRHLPPGTSAKGHKGLPRSRWLKRLGKGDQLVQYFKPRERPDWISTQEYEQLPESLVVREVRVRIHEVGRRTREVILVTTLLDARRYSARALAKLYGQRWQVEVNLRHLKETLGLDVLRCTTVPGVLKELQMFIVAYNLVRRVMTQAARQQRVLPDRISFVDALRWLQQAEAGEEVPKLRVNRERPGRAEPRVRKRRPKQYDLMRKPRAELKKTLKPKQRAA
jgi:hypothetical protein